MTATEDYLVVPYGRAATWCICSGFSRSQVAQPFGTGAVALLRRENGEMLWRSLA